MSCSEAPRCPSPPSAAGHFQLEGGKGNTWMQPSLLRQTACPVHRLSGNGLLLATTPVKLGGNKTKAINSRPTFSFIRQGVGGLVRMKFLWERFIRSSEYCADCTRKRPPEPEMQKMGNSWMHLGSTMEHDSIMSLECLKSRETLVQVARNGTRDLLTKSCVPSQGACQYASLVIKGCGQTLSRWKRDAA